MKRSRLSFSSFGFLLVATSLLAPLGCSRERPTFVGGETDAGNDVIIGIDAQPPTDAKQEAEVCGGEVQHAALVPLDLYIMLDRSESMLLKTSSGTTKWEATKKALTSFANDAKMESLSIGIQFFPFYHPGVPETCSTDPDCQGFGPCLHPSICSNHFNHGNIVVCQTDDDCNDGTSTGQCLPRGTCSNDTNKVCLPEFQQACSGALGDCNAVPATCEKRQSCDIDDYAKPAIEMLPRDQFAKQLQQSLDDHSPTGQTPTGPALAGALKYAKDFRASHPKHKPIVVLVTDGLPTDCTPTNIDEIAATAATEAPETLTYVIGVFDDEMAQQAQSNLDKIANSGGTNHALIIKTSTNVSQAFIDALVAIRQMAIDCTYEIPKPSTGPLHYDEINVYVSTGPNQNRALPYVTSAHNCDPSLGGWYYDQVPSDVATPTQILLCDNTCDSIQGNADAQVSVQLGCPTIVK